MDDLAQQIMTTNGPEGMRLNEQLEDLRQISREALITQANDSDNEAFVTNIEQVIRDNPNLFPILGKYYFQGEQPELDQVRAEAPKAGLGAPKIHVEFSKVEKKQAGPPAINVEPPEVEESIFMEEDNSHWKKNAQIINVEFPEVEEEQVKPPVINVKPPESVFMAEGNSHWKKNAQTNLRTLVDAMMDHYGERYKLEADEIEDIIKGVDYWEEKLGECSTEGNGGTMLSLNEDLRNFLLDNGHQIQPRIDEAIKEKKGGAG